MSTLLEDAATVRAQYDKVLEWLAQLTPANTPNDCGKCGFSCCRCDIASNE